MNWYVLFIAAAFPLIVGAFWYNQKVFGGALKKLSGQSSDAANAGHSALVYIMTYILGLFLASQMMSIVNHQMHIFSIFANDPNAKETGSDMMIFMEKYGKNFRSFGHGVFHGFFSSIIFVLPILGVIALFEKKGWKYIFIHTGYWAFTMMLMGGLIAAML